MAEEQNSCNDYVKDCITLPVTPRLKLYLQDVPLDDWSPRVLQGLLPVLEPGLVLLVLAPTELDLPDGISTTDQIVVANLGENTRQSPHQNEPVILP